MRVRGGEGCKTRGGGTYSYLFIIFYFLKRASIGLNTFMGDSRNVN